MVVAIPANLLKPMPFKGFVLVNMFTLPVTGSLISFSARSTMFVDVLNISDGNDMKLPNGNTRNALTVSDTYA